MEIKDLSAKIENAEEVRGGINDVNVFNADFSTLAAIQVNAVGNGNHGQNSFVNSPTTLEQGVYSPRDVSIHAPVTETNKLDINVLLDNNQFKF